MLPQVCMYFLSKTNLFLPSFLPLTVLGCTLHSLFNHGFGRVRWGRAGFGISFPSKLSFQTLSPHCHLTSMEQRGTCCWHAKTDPPEPLCDTDIVSQIAGGTGPFNPSYDGSRPPLQRAARVTPSDRLCSSVPSVFSTGSCTRRRLPADSRPLSGMENRYRGFQKKNTLRWCCLTARREKTGVGRWGHSGKLTISALN